MDQPDGPEIWGKENSQDDGAAILTLVDLIACQLLPFKNVVRLMGTGKIGYKNFVALFGLVSYYKLEKNILYLIVTLQFSSSIQSQ